MVDPKYVGSYFGGPRDKAIKHTKSQANLQKLQEMNKDFQNSRLKRNEELPDNMNTQGGLTTFRKG